MGKKKKNSTKAPNSPRPPPPQPSDTIPARGSDSKMKDGCERAIASFEQGNPKKALKIMKEQLSLYPNSMFVHHTQSVLLLKLYKITADSSTRLKRLQDAAFHAKEALSLFGPNSLVLIVHYNQILLRLAKDKNDCAQIIENCKQAHLVQEPIDYRFINELEGSSSDSLTKEERNRRIRVELETLVEKVKVAMWMMDIERGGGESGKVNSLNLIGDRCDDKWNRFPQGIKALMARLEAIGDKIRVTWHWQNKLWSGFGEWDGRRKTTSWRRSVANVEMKTKVGDVWKRMSSEERRKFVKINVDDIAEYYSNKNGLVMEVLIEALDLKRKTGKWTIWKCSCCKQRFFERKMWSDHLISAHTGLFFSEEEKTMRRESDPLWAEMIRNCVWKPVEVSETVKAFALQKQCEVVGNDPGEGGNLRGNSFWNEENCMYSDDIDRQNLLDKVRGMLSSFLHQMFVVRSVVLFSVEVLGAMTSGLKDLLPDLEKTPFCICFLSNQQLHLVFEMLQELSADCPTEVPLGRNGESLCEEESYDHEILAFSSDLTYLLLDERILKSKTESEDFGAEIDDGGASIVSPAKDPEDDCDNFIDWLCMGGDGAESLKLWEELKARKGEQSTDCLGFLKNALHQLQTIKAAKLRWLSYKEAISAVERIPQEESERRVEVSEHDPQSFASLLLKRHSEILDVGTADTEFELEILSDIIKCAQDVCRNKFGFEKELIGPDLRLYFSKRDKEDEERERMEELMSRADFCVDNAIVRVKVDLISQIFRFDILIAKLVLLMEMSERYFVFLSAFDHHSVIFHLSKSYIKNQVAAIADKNAKEKADAAKKALSIEVHSGKNIGAAAGDDSGITKKKSKHKKRGGPRKATDKVTCGSSDRLPTDAENAENADNVRAAVEQEQELQQEEWEIEFEKMQRQQEEMLEYQRRFEREAKQKRLAEKNEESDEPVAENMPQVSGELGDDQDSGLNTQEPKPEAVVPSGGALYFGSIKVDIKPSNPKQ